jgi:hypothetical protein
MKVLYSLFFNKARVKRVYNSDWRDFLKENYSKEDDKTRWVYTSMTASIVLTRRLFGAIESRN